MLFFELTGNISGHIRLEFQNFANNYYLSKQHSVRKTFDSHHWGLSVGWADVNVALELVLCSMLRNKTEK